MDDTMIKRKLVIGREATKDEDDLLTDFKEIIDITGKEIGYSDFDKKLGKEESYVIFYLLQSCWGFFRSIFNEWVDTGYHSAYVLGRAVIEYYIELCFLVKEDTKTRVKEYYSAYREGREPFERGKLSTIKQRAISAGLPDLYNQSYKSLCSFSHLDLRGSLIARNTEKFRNDKNKFLCHMITTYLEMFEIISNKYNIDYSEPFKKLTLEKLNKHRT